MVQSAPAIVHAPIFAAIRPPGIIPVRIADKFAAQIDPAMRVFETLERFNLDRRVADHFEKLFVVPDIAFHRCDIEIANDQRRRFNRLCPIGHASQKIELLPEFGVLFAVGFIAACGNIDIVDAHRFSVDFSAYDLNPDMARLAIGLPVVARIFADRHAADGGNAVIAFLPANRLMLISKFCQSLCRELMLLTFDFLKAQNIGRMIAQISLDDRQAQTRRIDVPCGDTKHGSGFRMQIAKTPPFTFPPCFKAIAVLPNGDPHMKRNLAALLTASALSLGACTADQGAPSVASASQPAAIEAPSAKNVILFIGDGMGISTITAARIYAGQKRGGSGEENVLPFETFDNVALVKTYNTNAQVPDSAGTATAMHSGSKTRIGVVGIGPQATRGSCADALAHPLPLLGEEVKQRGLALGIVSTARITHATPASVYARSADRNWEGFIDPKSGQDEAGCKDIAQQLIEADWDVALGGGRYNFFGSEADGRRTSPSANLAARWVSRTGGSYVTNADELGKAPMDAPVLGLFSQSHMTYTAERGADNAEPTLTDMTAQAIARLKTDPDGFYLMVESGRIDHAHHDGRAGVALEETVEFARAIQHAIDNTDPNETLIMVTADHSHVFTIAGYPRRGNDILGLVVPPAGDISNTEEPLPANDGKPYTTLGYANGPGAIAGMDPRPHPETGVSARQQATIPLSSETHAGEDVALYAQGPGAQKARGVIEQNVIYDIIRSAFGWE